MPGIECDDGADVFAAIATGLGHFADYDARAELSAGAGSGSRHVQPTASGARRKCGFSGIHWPDAGKPADHLGGGDADFTTEYAVILAESQSTAHSDINGVASAALTTVVMSGNIAVLGSATAGNSSVAYEASTIGTVSFLDWP